MNDSSHSSGGDTTAPYQVLIIEDDPLILDILTFKFKKFGWEVLSAVDGEGGLESMRKTRPNIVLLDILLPGMSGYEVLETIKADESLKTVPVLVLSNYGQPEEVKKSLDLGAADHLIKANVIIDTVVDRARDVIDSAQKSNEN